MLSGILDFRFSTFYCLTHLFPCRFEVFYVIFLFLLILIVGLMFTDYGLGLASAILFL